MTKLENLGSKISKTNVMTEIRTFKVRYRPNFVKIKKLILFDPKCPNLEIWPQNF